MNPKKEKKMKMRWLLVLQLGTGFKPGQIYLYNALLLL